MTKVCRVDQRKEYKTIRTMKKKQTQKYKKTKKWLLMRSLPTKRINKIGQ